MSPPIDPAAETNNASPAIAPARDRKQKLGKGLSALMGDTRREEPLVDMMRGDNSTMSAGEAPTTGLASLTISDISPLPGQPRQHFDEDALNELAASIASRGVIQPIIVTKARGGKYRLVAGERRWRAAQKARLHEIPAIIQDLSEADVMAIALIENLQREDLNPMEEARAYHRLSEDEGLTQAEIAEMVDKSRSHVANLQRLVSLPDDVKNLVESGDLSMGHARALIGHERASVLAKQAVAQGLSVRDVEKLVKKPATDGSNEMRRTRSARDPVKDADIAAVQAHLEEFLGLNVRIKTDSDPRSGTVTIKYRTLDQLDLICQRLTGGDI